MDMNILIKESPSAMASVISVLNHNGIDHSKLSIDEQVNKSREISAPCRHQWDRPYHGHGTRKCFKCGGLQDN